MYLYFDKNGALKEIINNEAIRKGNSNYNKVYCYFEGGTSTFTGLYWLLKYPDGTLGNETSFTGSQYVESGQVPFDKKRDYKYFKDYETYTFNVFTLTGSLTQDGLYSLTIRATITDGIGAMGMVTFNAEANVIKSDANITQSQYDYLLGVISEFISVYIENAVPSLSADGNGTITNESSIQLKRIDGLKDFFIQLSNTLLSIGANTTGQHTRIDMTPAIIQLSTSLESNGTDNKFEILLYSDKIYVNKVVSTIGGSVSTRILTISDSSISYKGHTLLTKVNTNDIYDEAVTRDKLSQELQDLLQEVLTSIPDGSITTIKLVDGAVTTAKINDGAVTTDKLNNGSVTTLKIDNKAVTKAKLEQTLQDLVDLLAVIIPSTATSSNKLADESYVNDQINSVSAYYITKNAQGDAFASVSELTGATTYYSGGVARVPTRNDYAIVLDDANHDDATTRYSYQGSQWEYQYTINEAPLTQPQLNALNSGVTSPKVVAYDNHLQNTNNPHGVTKAQVGLGNVDNTSDANKPISNATQQALNNKADLVDGKLPVSQLPATGVTVDIARALAVGSTGTITGDKVVEDFDKNFYNMGAYDTKSVSDNVVTITRQTGYLKLDGLDFVQPYQGYFYCTKVLDNADVSSEDYDNLVLAGYTSVNIGDLGNLTPNLTVSFNASKQLLIRNDSCTSVDAIKQALQGKVLQYKTSTSYTEQVILDQPLNTLDQNGSQWVREEWLKGLNLIDASSTPYIDNYGNSGVVFDTSIASVVSISLSATCQYIAFYPITNISGNNVTITTTGEKVYSNVSKVENVILDTSISKYYIKAEKSNNWNYIKTDGNVMLNEGNHAYPYQDYNKSKHITNEEAQFVEDELARVSSEGAVVHKQELDDKLGNISSVDTGTANVINVLANSERAKLLELSSLSHKSKNKFVIDDIAQTTTASGLTYDMTNGILTVNGTTTASTSIVIPLRVAIASGTYKVADNTSNYYVDYRTWCNTNADGSGNDFSDIKGYNANYTTNFVAKSLKLYIDSGVTLTNFTLKYILVDELQDPTPFEKGSLDLFNSLPTGIRSVGINIWDEEWEVGSLYNNGTNNDNANDYVRSKNYIEVVGGNNYYIKQSNLQDFKVVFYDANKNGVDYQYGLSGVVSVPSNVKYIRFSYYGTTYNHDICINVSNASINGTYYPYKEAYIPLVLAEKYAWGINDSCKNKIVYDKDKGIGTPIVDRVDLGTLNWSYDAEYKRFGVELPLAKGLEDPYQLVNYLCAEYTNVTPNYFDANINEDMLIRGGTNNIGYVWIRNLSYTDATAFKTAMSGVYLYYEVASVTQEELAPLPNFMVEKGGTITIENPLNQDKGYKVMYYLDWINEQLQEAINDAETPVLLWQNGSPTSAFAGQTITTADMSGYKYLVIEYKESGASSSRGKIIQKFVNETNKTATISFNYIYQDTTLYCLTRKLTPTSSTTISIGKGFANTNEDNDACVPIRIYGTNIL